MSATPLVPALERFVAQAQSRTQERAAPADCVLALAPLMLELVEQAGDFLQPQHYRSEPDHYARNLVYDAPDAQGLPTRVEGPSLSKAAGFEPPAGYRTLHVSQVSAGDLGLLAEALYANKRPFAADEALYLRSPDVTLSAGPKRVTS